MRVSRWTHQAKDFLRDEWHEIACHQSSGYDTDASQLFQVIPLELITLLTRECSNHSHFREIAVSFAINIKAFCLLISIAVLVQRSLSKQWILLTLDIEIILMSQTINSSSLWTFAVSVTLFAQFDLRWMFLISVTLSPPFDLLNQWTYHKKGYVGGTEIRKTIEAQLCEST